MSDYRLEFDSITGSGDTDRLYDLLSIISEGDELEIIMDKKDSEQTHTVIGVLGENDFCVSSREDGGQFHIIAHRRSEHRNIEEKPSVYD